MPDRYPNRLHELRQRSRLTQAEVAKMLDISMSSVAKHEIGTRQPSRDEIIAYARLYKVQTYELFLPIQNPVQPAEGGNVEAPYYGRLAVSDPATVARITALDSIALPEHRFFGSDSDDREEELVRG